METEIFKIFQNTILFEYIDLQESFMQKKYIGFILRKEIILIIMEIVEEHTTH